MAGAPSDQFLRLLYGGPLRSVSSLTMWRAPQVSFFAYYRGSLQIRNNQYHNYNTRQSRSLHSSVGRGEAICRSFSFHGVNMWNYLSKHIPTNVSYNRFNKLTKSYLLNNNIIYRLFSMFVYCSIVTPSDQFLRLLYGGPPGPFLRLL